MADDMLERYPNEVQTLPCITPNRLVLPKQQTFLEYNVVHQCVAGILSQLGFDRYIDKIYKIVGIRLVSGRPDPKSTIRRHKSRKTLGIKMQIEVFFKKKTVLTVALQT